jgi:homogentisate 1,2-dioxygenase
MIHFKKGKVAQQAHVGLPEDTFEEEHGRRGFYGKSAHLYHTHPPTGWVRIEGKLRPHCFDCNRLEPSGRNDARGGPITFLANNDVKISVSRRSAAMPFYYRNADGDELIFVHRGHGKIETDFGPLDYERGDYVVVPKAVTYRILPATTAIFSAKTTSARAWPRCIRGGCTMARTPRLCATRTSRLTRMNMR